MNLADDQNAVIIMVASCTIARIITNILHQYRDTTKQVSDLLITDLEEDLDSYNGCKLFPEVFDRICLGALEQVDICCFSVQQ